MISEFPARASSAASPDEPSLPYAWQALYSEGVPARIVPEFPDMLSFFRTAVAAHPGQTALRYFDRDISFDQLDHESDALAVWLLHRGVAAGARVAIVAHNIPALPIASIAAWKIGAIPIPGNPMYQAGEFARILADAAPSALVCQDIDIEKMRKALAIAGLCDIPVLTISPRDHQSRDDGRVLPPRFEECQDGYGKMLTAFLGQRPPDISVRSIDPALILYTSGTTGMPKGAVLNHGAIAFNAVTSREWFGKLGTNDSVLAMAPLFHITGFVCHFCTALVAACPMVLCYRFDPQVVRDAMREHRPTFIIGAITAFNALASLPDISAEDMASATKVYSGGAPVPPALRDVIEERLKIAVHTAYGMTELAAPAVITPYGLTPPQRSDVLSIGIPISSTDVRIVDDTGNVLSTGEAGELLVRGPQLMDGYWNKPDETASALKGGWMHTGDVAFMDESGWVYLVDRKKDVIIASGFKVWPREVEDVLYAHPAVREAAVIGIPDAYRGETVVACVSTVAGQTLDEKDLIEWCRQHLTGYKVPRLVRVLEDLPKTVTGKIQRTALREAELRIEPA